MGQLKRPPGWNHTDKAKEKISKKLREHHAELRAMGIPTTRQCVRCKEVKNVAKDFTWRKRKLADGSYSYHPYPRCKECKAKEQAERRASKTVEERRADDRRWYRNRAERERQVRRQARGQADTRSAVHVDAAPFLEWYDAQSVGLAPGDTHPTNPSQTQLRRINDARRKGTINLRIADEILTKVGNHEMVAIWWPQV